MPPQDTAAYYDAVVKAMGGLEKTRDFFRFFAAPGMGHCSGGPGPNQFDALAAEADRRARCREGLQELGQAAEPGGGRPP